MIQTQEGKINEELYALGNIAVPVYLFLNQTPVLFDAGVSFLGPRYIRELEQYLGDPTRLRFNLLTHSHYDHCGASPYLKRKIPGLQMGASRLAAEVFARPNALELIRSLNLESAGMYSSPPPGEDTSIDKLEVDLILGEGDEIDLGGGHPIQVLATPGHTRDGLSYYFPHLKALIPGEAAGTYDRFFNIRPAFASSLEDYLSSLEKLARLEVNLLLLGHFFIITGEEASGFVPRSIQTTLEYKEKIKRYLDSVGGDQEAVVQKMYQEEYVQKRSVRQEEKPFLLNMRAAVKAVASSR